MPVPTGESDERRGIGIGELETEMVGQDSVTVGSGGLGTETQHLGPPLGSRLEGDHIPHVGRVPVAVEPTVPGSTSRARGASEGTFSGAQHSLGLVQGGDDVLAIRAEERLDHAPDPISAAAHRLGDGAELGGQ